MRYLSFIIFSFCFLLISCEKEITVNLPQPTSQIVVEGYIENDLAPYVFLTRNSPYFGDFDVNDLSKYFVSGAQITVYSDADSVKLIEYSSELINLLPEEEKAELSKFFGIPLDSNLQIPKISVYTIPLESTFVGEFGKTYRLKIEVEGKLLTATTTIPQPVSFDRLWTVPHPNPEYDSLVQLKGFIQDPDTLGNYYRYFTKKNSSMYTKGFQTVFDDLLVNGKSFDIQIPYGWDRFAEDQEFDFNTFGFWNKTDTCIVKLCVIDKAHYDFWRTLENELGNQGSPFGTFTRIRTNIQGGLGVWGGYASSISTYYPE